MDFLQDHPLYVVGIIATVIWLGIFMFLLRLDSRVKKLEKMK
jgi:CcmD family protein